VWDARGIYNVVQSVLRFLVRSARSPCIVTRQTSRPLQAHCHHGLGRLYHQTGRAAPARTALAAAINLYRAMGMTLWLPQAEAALAQVEGQ
jgi:hypothetical protein